MDGRMTKGAVGRRRTAKVVMIAGTMLLGLTTVRSPSSGALRLRSARDIHSEYVKYTSGKDTVTAYIAYPERPQPAPAVIVIPGVKIVCQVSHPPVLGTAIGPVTSTPSTSTW